MNQGDHRGLAVAAGHGDDRRRAQAGRQFNLGPDRYPALPGPLQGRGIHPDPGAGDHQVLLLDQRPAVPAALHTDPVLSGLRQELLVEVSNRALVRDPDLGPAGAQQLRRGQTTAGQPQDQHLFSRKIHYRIFNVVSVNKARMIPTIQNRMMILDSFQPHN